MIEQLVAILEQKFKDLTAEEIADILWLTLQQWQSTAATLPKTQPGVSDSESPSDEIVPPDNAPVIPQSPETPPSVPALPQHEIVGVTTSHPQPKTPSQAKSTLGAPLAIPDAPALRNSLEILRSLRPLIRRVPSSQVSYLDVPATVQAIAKTDLWTLKLQPVLEPWLELAIVVDATPSMVIWQRTILSLRRVLAQSGVFRDVRMWSLETQDSPNLSANENSPEPKLCIRAGFGPAATLQPPCRPQELLDPNGRRLILVISDCIAPRWDSQPIRDMLQVWAEHGPMALVQVLPEWLWNRTALSEVVKGQVYSHTPGQSNQSLTFVRRERWRRNIPVGVKVPVLTLEPAVARRWSQMVAGKTAVSAPGLLFSSVSAQGSSLKRSPDSNSAQSTLTPQQRLEQFRNFSSPMARRLAGLLAACPEVNLPIVRLVQAALLPDAQQVHVAEVLLGGLFKPQTEMTAHTPADQVQYVFHDDVQPLVQDTVTPDRAFAALSTWLNHRFGYSLADFRAYVTSGDIEKEKQHIEQVKPFAGILLDVLKRRGDEYAEIVKRIEQPQYTTFTELTQHEAATQDYAIRSRIGSSGIAVIAIHGGNLQPGTTEIADAVAGDIHSFYSFVSLKPEIDQTLYIRSTQFNEPIALEIVGEAQIVLSIHGCQGKTEFIKVGGLDTDRRDLIEAELQAAGFSVSNDDSGTNPANICNRNRTGQGVQIEISRGLRKRFINSVDNIQDVTSFTQFVAVLQRCLQVSVITGKVTSQSEITILESSLPDLKTLEFETARLVKTSDVDSAFPLLQVEQFTIATITIESEPETTEYDLQPFEFTVATLTQSGKQWVIQRQQGSSYQFIEVLDENLILEMVAIPEGTFLMGSPQQERESYENERPQHEVVISSFLMGKYPITQAQWRFVASLPRVNRFLKPNPSQFKGDNRPVECVSWYDAVEFCQRFSQYTHRTYRLPTEAEWEYACRAGTTTPFHFGETITTDLANYRGTENKEYDWLGPYGRGPKGEYREETTAVDHFGIANAFGLCDMHGNVYEWCLDHWHSNYEDALNDGSAWLTDDEDAFRVLRGGSWNYYPRSCRCASRFCSGPVSGFNDLGFRVVCEFPRILQ